MSCGRWGAAATALLLAALAAACGARETRIGAILPLSGLGEIYGQMAKRGIDLAVDEINARGGVRGKPLAILYRDSRGVPSAGLEAAMNLIDEEGVNAIIGDLLSDVTLEVAALADKRQVVLFSPGSSVPKLTQAGLYVFRNYPSDALEGAYVAQIASEKLRLLDMVIVAVSNSYGQGLKEAFMKYYTGPNREVHKVLNFPEGNPDVASIANQIEEVRPDGVYLIAYAPDRQKILEELRRRKITARIIGTRDSRELILGLGPLAEGMIVPLDEYDPSGPDPVVQEFVREYKEKYNSEVPGLWAAQAYDATLLLARAIDEAKGTYGQDVQIQLTTIKGFRGATGLTELDANGDVSRRPKIYVVHGGAFVPYDEYEAAQASAS
ncbi:MAG: ABC transporter substrate-binding protein [Candidatus Rokubacteria bacterium]|nr:ABC transporter substrate-binding protein [Candidatus Rokubacteria bacterium]